MLFYNNPLGPSVRIGVLQHQKQIRLTLDGKYRIVGSGGTLNGAWDTHAQFCFATEGSAPAQLQWRLVFLKSPGEGTADAYPAPEPDFEPLATVRLGFDLGSSASATEYWRCSRPFGSLSAAEQARATLPHPERIGILSEVLTPPAGGVTMTAGGNSTTLDRFVRFEPRHPDRDRAVIHDVVVGVGFHWEHSERQRFRGAIEVRIDNLGSLTAVNEVAAEEYLFSVNSSEMMSVMPEELLKAQTVAARNTLFATMGKHHHADAFHLCADDHCQCYRGCSRETADSRRVTLATVGEVLTFEGQICDCRYSKMCGGIMEAFDSVWNEDPRGYLPAGVDAPAGTDAHGWKPVDTDERAREYIAARPKCWCNTTGDDVPQYLHYSAPYFRWEVRYPRADAEAMIARVIGRGIGQLKALVPLSRGASGRIEYLRVETTEGQWTIGKEYQIRKALSNTFLYSSCFVVDYEREPDGSIREVVLRGGGWGHGAGLCQVGATMMAYRGIGYREILEHYYPNSRLSALGAGVPEKRLAVIVGQTESRAGERCYEFYNCYAVARCPVYIESVRLEAVEKGAGFVFRQPADAEKMDLEARKIECEFLTFSGSEAEPLA
jgi:stage II sporulation protein D